LPVRVLAPYETTHSSGAFFGRDFQCLEIQPALCVDSWLPSSRTSLRSRAPRHVGLTPAATFARGPDWHLWRLPPSTPVLRGGTRAADGHTETRLPERGRTAAESPLTATTVRIVGGARALGRLHTGRRRRPSPAATSWGMIFGSDHLVPRAQ
jgi:hypothetical protein